LWLCGLREKFGGRTQDRYAESGQQKRSFHRVNHHSSITPRH